MKHDISLMVRINDDFCLLGNKGLEEHEEHEKHDLMHNMFI